MQLNRVLSELFSYNNEILSLFFRPRHLQKFHLIGSMLESQKLPKNLSVRRSSWQDNLDPEFQEEPDFQRFITMCIFDENFQKILKKLSLVLKTLTCCKRNGKVNRSFIIEATKAKCTLSSSALTFHQFQKNGRGSSQFKLKY